jgi:ABC-2 type transport system permease protein
MSETSLAKAPAGVIHDIGYRKYEGVRLGRGYGARSLYTHSVRTAFGLGRGLKAKLFPWSIVGVVTGVAVILTAITSQTGEKASTYPEFVDVMGLLAMIFLATVAPELVSRDLRSRVLTLYFARPVRRTDYVYAKYAALVTAVFLLLAGPQLIMFAGAAFDSGSVSEFRRALTDLLGGWLYAGIYALVTAAVALVVASLTGRRAFAAGGIVAVFMVTVPIAGVLSVLGGGTVQKLAGLVNPTWIVQGIGVWLLDHDVAFTVGDFGPVYAAAAVVVVAASLAILLARYRKVEQ